jgi:antitoxin component of RelBE/YafQ-DinJ toxin-antitoxin module
MAKKHQIGLRVDDEELARLHELSSFFGIGQHEALRMLLRVSAPELLARNRQGSR